ncbi:MAG: twin-arginine translocase TatA/TatE family subunit [Planctomycetes bacterium]|nr:twin-arginine translocase TatA/TatE family subunit [Planctomycetota bacterium]
MNAYLAFFGLPGGTEIIVIGIIALLLFGSRLPKVAKSMGKSIVEFKKGIKGVQDEIEDASDDAPSSPGDDASPPPPGDDSGKRKKGDLSNPGEDASS